MQQFILEEQLEVICDEDGREYEEIAEFDKDVVFPPLNKRDLSLYIQRREKNRMITIKQL